MSQENVEIVKAAYEAWNAGDIDALGDLYDPDVVLRPLKGWPEQETHVGREAVMREWERIRDAWDADVVELISGFIEAGDRVAVRTVWHGVGRGPEANMEMTGVYTVRDARIFYMEFFWDHAEALETLGLREQSRSRKNVELTRAYFEEIARASREDFDTEATISKMAEFFDPEIEWDTSGGPVLETAGVYRGIEGARKWCP
jgi:ketosteroid isomerase-like protein